MTRAFQIQAGQASESGGPHHGSSSYGPLRWGDKTGRLLGRRNKKERESRNRKARKLVSERLLEDIARDGGSARL